MYLIPLAFSALCLLVLPTCQGAPAQQQVSSFLASLSSLMAQFFQNPVERSFKVGGIVPAVIPKAPKELVEVNYNGTQAMLGNQINQTVVGSQPTEVEWDVKKCGGQNAQYTLAMIDPDSGNETYVLHRLVVNIPGDDVANGIAVAPYWGPGPPAGSWRKKQFRIKIRPILAIHRYVVLVYKQSGNITNTQEMTPETRLAFNMVKYASENGFGNPVAGNYFRVQGV